MLGATPAPCPSTSTGCGVREPGGGVPSITAACCGWPSPARGGSPPRGAQGPAPGQPDPRGGAVRARLEKDLPWWWSPRTPTSGSRRTPSAWWRRITRATGWTSRSSTAASARCRREGVHRRLLPRRGMRPAPGAEDLYPNEYVVFRDAATQSSALGRQDGARKRIRLLPPMKDDVWGVRPRNKEQHFALDVLLDDSVKLVTLAGRRDGEDAARHRRGAAQDLRRGGVPADARFPPRPADGKDLGFLPGTSRRSSSPGCSRSSTTWSTSSASTGKSGRGASGDTRS